MSRLDTIRLTWRAEFMPRCAKSCTCGQGTSQCQAGSESRARSTLH